MTDMSLIPVPDEPIEQGFFFDGQTARIQPVEVKLKPDVLMFRVVGETKPYAWPISEIRFEYDPRQLPPVIRAYRKTKGVSQRLDVSDGKYIGIFRKTMAERLKARRFWNELDAGDALRWTSVAVALMVTLYFVWPTLADTLAPLLPSRYIAMVGNQQMKFLTAHAHQCHNPEGQKILDGVLLRLAGPQAIADGLTVNLYDGGEINAYAVPPTHLVLMDGLLQHVDSGDQIVAVIAHETGHIKAGHAARLAMRNIGTTLLGQFIGIDQSVVLLNMAHSREMESEADARGLDMMRAAHISPVAMVDLFKGFERMEKQSDHSSLNFKFLNYLNSHPLTAEREQIAEQAAAAYKDDNQPVINDHDWHVLRGMCEGQKEIRIKAAADMGDDKAEVQLATHYLQGTDSHADPKQAFKLASEAAQDGDAVGEYLVGYMYLSGTGVEPDEKQAFSYIQKAADQGFGPASQYLSVMYKYGIGTASNDVQAKLYADNSKEQKARAGMQEIIADVVRVQLSLAVTYDSGNGRPKDPAHAFILVQRAAQTGDPRAQFYLARQYLVGDGTAKDPAKAFDWTQKAADQGFGKAQMGLAILYKSGIGVPADQAQADKWRNLAVAGGQKDVLASPEPAAMPSLPPMPPVPGSASIDSSTAADTGATLSSRASEQGKEPVKDAENTPSDRQQDPITSSLAPVPPTPIARPPAEAPVAQAVVVPAPAGQSLPNPQTDTYMVAAWVAVHAPSVLTFSDQDATQAMARSEKLFTPQGWQGFRAAMQQAHFVDSVVTNKLHVNMAFSDSPQAVVRTDAAGEVSWDVSGIAEMDFDGESGHSSSQSHLLLHIMRVPAEQGIEGLAIDNWETAN